MTNRVPLTDNEVSTSADCFCVSSDPDSSSVTSGGMAPAAAIETLLDAAMSRVNTPPSPGDAHHVTQINHNSRVCIVAAVQHTTPQGPVHQDNVTVSRYQREPNTQR